MKLHITWLGQKKEIKTKFGPKNKASLKATEYGDNYLDFWCSPMTDAWKVGDEIEVLDVTNREYNGKTYHDIVLPKANGGNNAEVMKALEEVRNQNTQILLGLREIYKIVAPPVKSKVVGTDLDYPEMEAEPSFETVQEDNGIDF